jgi:GH18 family chitinase
MNNQNNLYIFPRWDTNAGHHSALNGKDSQDYLYIDFIVKYYESKGAPRNKLMLGLANYGRSDAPAMPYTGFKGILFF